MSVTIQDDQVVVVLSVARRVSVRGGTKLTHQGTRGLVYRRRKTSPGWVLADRFEIVNKLDDPVLELSFGGIREDEYLQRKIHEDMCYRPGTSSFPMDGPMTRI